MSDIILPTGKQHISFSEIQTWKECSWRWKLAYVDRVGEREESPHASFGTCVHTSVESFLETRESDPDGCCRSIAETWEKFGFGDPSTWQASARAIIADFPAFIDAELPGWECLSTEEKLMEAIPSQAGVSFKGFVDAVLVVPDRGNKKKRWIVDLKTCSWGWSSEKKSSPTVRSQLLLYREFHARKHSIDPKDVRCAFALLKRQAKIGKTCELVRVSAGEVSSKRSLAVVDRMVENVSRELYPKNRNACRYCQYKDTQWCP